MSLSSLLQMVFEFMHRLDRVIFFMRMITALNIIPWMMLKVMIMAMKMLTLSRFWLKFLPLPF
jgi:hypothetical protein